ncbi:MAG: flagellar hook-associated protein FlgK [Gemmatimonadetes bacterium]|nr:flagellar hook-associated protein FlgK [Gemmatimonadota bacterium]
MSTGLFSIARTALTAHQASLQTISQNIANAETPGYSRQEVVLSANTPVRFSYGSVGTGVHIATVQRKRDLLLDDQFRDASGAAGQASMRNTLMQQMEGVFGEPTDQGMANALDQFFSSWSDLSAAPNSLPARAVVQQRGRQLGQLFNDYDTQLTQLRSTNLSRLQSNVDEVNALATQVAELNTRIITSESNGNQNNDLRDIRDAKLDDLARIAGTRAILQPTGTVTVFLGNSVLVEGNSASPLRAELVTIVPTPTVPVTDVPVRLRLGDAQDALKPLGGEIDAVVRVLNSDLPQMRGRLDAMASQLVSRVNTAHTAGFVFSGNTLPGTAAGNFFDAGTVSNPVRASTIRLDAAVLADPGKIAASGNANGPSDNAAAQAISALRIASNTVTWTDPNGATETGTYASFFRGAMTRLGIEVLAASDQNGVASSLVDQAELRRQSVSGVNTDEELVNMMRVQQSYQAAAKMIKAAEEMLDVLLSLA